MKVHSPAAKAAIARKAEPKPGPLKEMEELPDDQVELGEKRSFLNGSTLLRAAKWGAIGAAAGSLPFVLGAKAGMYTSAFASGGIVNAIADHREGGIGKQVLWTAAGALPTLPIAMAGTYLGAINDGFSNSQIIKGALALGTFCAGVSLAGDAISYWRSLED